MKTEVEKLKSRGSFDEDYLKEFLEKGFRNENTAHKYYKYLGIMDGDLDKKWDERIQDLDNILSELYKINDDKLSELIDAIVNRVNKEIDNCESYKQEIDIYNACTEKKLARGHTPGINGNCVLESITKTINRANDNEKADPLKAYEEATKWEEILRATADEIGIHHSFGFVLGYNNIKEQLNAKKMNGTYEAYYSKFQKILQWNLDNYILTEWVYDDVSKKLIKKTEIKGVNSNKNSKRINVLENPGHEEPLFSIEEVDQNINLEPSQITKIEKIKSHLTNWKTATENSLWTNVLLKVKKLFSKNNDKENIENTENKQTDKIAENSDNRLADKTNEHPEASQVQNASHEEAINNALEMEGFARGNTQEDKNSLLYSILEVMDHAEGKKSDNAVMKKWVKDIRKIAVECGFKHEEKLDIANAWEKGSKEYKLRDRMKEQLQDKTLNIWIYNEDMQMLMHYNTIKGNDVNKNENPVELHIFYDYGAKQYTSLFQRYSSQNTSGNISENMETYSDYQSDGETDNHSVQSETDNYSAQSETDNYSAQSETDNYSAQSETDNYSDSI